MGYGLIVAGWVFQQPIFIAEYETLVSAVSPMAPIHCTVIVVVGSRCQVRNSVVGWKAGSSWAFSTALAGVSAPRSRPDTSPAIEAPRNMRREVGNMWAAPRGFAECS